MLEGSMVVVNHPTGDKYNSLSISNICHYWQGYLIYYTESSLYWLFQVTSPRLLLLITVTFTMNISETIGINKRYYDFKHYYLIFRQTLYRNKYKYNWEQKY